MKPAFSAALLATLACAGAVHAQDFQPKAKGGLVLDVRLSQVAPEGDDPVTTLAGAAAGLKAHVSDDVMPTVGLQYFLTDHLAVEAIAGTTKHSVHAQAPGVDIVVKETWVLPPVVTLQYHFAPTARVSPYVGAGVNYMAFYKGKNVNGFDFDIDDGFGTALQAGVDVALRGRWTLNADVKKVFFETDAVDSKAGLKAKVTLDPVVASMGLGYRF
jgi:outer membrane protein